MKTGTELIAEERQRQIDVEGWTPEHDDAHRHGELASAGQAYAGMAVFQTLMKGVALGHYNPSVWPWSREGWKPAPDPLRNLVKAGALIAAEIDRLQRIPS